MKQKGDKASYAYAAPTGRIMGEIYKQRHRAQGGRRRTTSTAPDSLNEMLSGKLDFGMHDPVFSLAQQREGPPAHSRGLDRHSGWKRCRTMPTMTELGIPMDLTGWWAAMVPAGTPKPVVDKIHQWFVQMVSSEETKKFLNSFGGDPYINSPEQGQAMLERDVKAGATTSASPRSSRCDCAIAERTYMDQSGQNEHAAIQLSRRRVRAPAGARHGAGVAHAQDYPSQDIRMIVGFPAGSGADIFVRYFAEKLRPIAGRTVIVENKVGAELERRDRVRGALQAGRPRALSVRRHHRRGEHAPVQEPAGRRRQGAEGRAPPPATSPSCSWSMPRARTRPWPS